MTARHSIDVQDLRGMLERGEPVIVLDVRKVEDRSEWFIPGSVHVDAYEALKAGAPDALVGADLPGDRPVVTVCGAGKTSAIAAEQLCARGYEALSLEGGMKAWSLAWNTAEVPVPQTEARIVQVRRTGKGCLSYLVGSDGKAAVIDASLSPEVYLGLADDNGWSITAVLDTHVHADHLSRSRELARLSRATLYMPEQKRTSYPFEGLQDGDTVEIGAARLVAIYSPGHSPESTCYLLDGKVLFTGDTLFLDGVGRPDLESKGIGGAEVRKRAYDLHCSLRRLLNLPSKTLILPGHTSEPVSFNREPLCASLAELTEKAEVLRAPEEDFVEAVLARIPPTPPNYRRIVELNEAGVLLEEELTELEAGANRCAVS